MTPTRRSLALGAMAAGAAAAGSLAAPSATAAFSLGGGDAFAVDGKKGPYVKQVAGHDFGLGGRGGGSLGLASDAVNLGRYQTARLRMPQTEAKVAQLLARLDARWPYAKGQPLQVQILGVDYYNAYSLPDGSIVVAFGLLDGAQSDDEVAFVLAHELGHVRLGHFARQPNTDEKRARLASQLGLMFAVGSAFQLHGATGAALSAAARAGATNDLIHFLSNVMVEPVHTRDQEDEADCIGYDLSEAADYSADSASARVFDTIQADRQKHQALMDTLGTQLKDQLGHAVTSGEAANLLTGGGDLKTDLLVGAGRMALSVAAARSGDQGPQHRPPQERKRDMATYSAEAYPDGAPLRDEQHAWLTDVRATTEFAQAKVAVGAVRDAQQARAKGDYQTATAALQRAAQTSFGRAPLVLNESARLADDMGDQAGSDRLFEEADASPDQTVEGYVDHVRMLYKARQNDRAMQIADEGERRFGDDKPFIALRIAVARQAGREAEARGYLQTCLGYDNEALARDCKAAAGDSGDGGSRPHLPAGLPFGLPHFP